ncbi:hypothetical protein [Parendozoicomonas sp. Alg238-R29]|uniref:hypothetical protein n=1 Tax=Parendozoicomonas sp. Alg238-R29 TaxID=2993446 RepID=UPI00248DF3B0|nr:hypothetical protein [Parendozoicomonas sp. Alg238-R29]
MKSTESGFVKPVGRKRSQAPEEPSDGGTVYRKKIKTDFIYREKRSSKRIASRKLEPVCSNLTLNKGTPNFKIINRGGLNLRFGDDDKIKYSEFIREIHCLHSSNAQHGLKDTYSKSFLKSENHYIRERRNQEVYQKGQDLLEELPPHELHSGKLFKAVVKGQLVRELETTRCDGWCYSWIYDWFFHGSLIPSVMLATLEVKTGNGREILRHYFLLVPVDTDTEVKKCLKSERVNTLYISGEDSCKKVISGSELFIYDPSFCNLSLFNPDNVFRMAKDYCDIDGYTLDSFNVKKVEFFQKNPKLMGFEESDVAFLARRILLASISWFFDGVYQFNSVYDNDCGVISQLKFEPSDICPNELKKGLKFHISTLYCLAKIIPGSLLPEGGVRPNKLDVLQCYRPDHSLFTLTLTETLKELLQKGFAPGACIAALSADHGGNNALKNKVLVPIPEEIYNKYCSKLKDQYDWANLGEALFVELGIDTEQEPPSFSKVLIILFEKYKKPGEFVSKLQAYIDTWGGVESREFRRSLVFNHKELRSDLQKAIALSGKMYTPHCLLKHCIRQCWQDKDQEYSEIIKRCKPIHTLAVCATESEAYQRALVEYFQNASERELSFKEMAEELNFNQGGRCNICIAPPVSVTKSGKRIDSWNELLIEEIMTDYINEDKVIPRSIPPEDKLKLFIYKLSDFCCARKPLWSMRSSLFNNKSIINIISSAHPELSRSQVEKNNSSCLRYLLKLYQSPVLNDEIIQSNKGKADFDLYLHPYDEVMILEPHSKEWNESLTMFIEHLLSEGFNLTKISYFFREGTINHNKYSIPLSGGSGCHWTFVDLIVFLEGQGKNTACLREKFSKNRAFDLELKLYEKDQSVGEYDGLLFYYMNYSIKDEGRRINALTTFVNRNSITIPEKAEEFSSKTQYYELLLDRLDVEV